MCFVKKDKGNNGSNELSPTEFVNKKYKYNQILVVQNAHDTEINCIKATPSYNHWQVHFVTGAFREIKLWSKGICVANVLTAHSSKINNIETLLFNVDPNRNNNLNSRSNHEDNPAN